ncbi:MAG TPA: hypothetical protein VLP43_04370 [Solirubrobacteraceae bacterium]|nr:hypothetical protein [Solirubrobacteraceae bacterium]
MLNTDGAVTTEYLVRLVYELLDAHGDTVDLAQRGASEDSTWDAHIDYLQTLQRLGRETLSRVS